MTGRFEGKVAFITGAARGQGRSHALALAAEGADIIAVDVCNQVDSVPYPMSTPDDLQDTVAQVEALDRRILATQADVRDAAAVKEALDAGVAEFGRLDVVSANAGIASNSPAADMSPQMWADMIDINLTGVFHTVQPAIRHLVDGGRGGAIVITSSSVALRPVQNLSHYASAKNGLIGFTRTLALELAPHHIRVNSLHPTNTDTDMIQNDAIRRLFLPDEEHPTREQSEPIYTTLNALPIPWIESSDVTNALLFLASDEARYVTGVAMPIDAGFALL